MNLTCAIIHSPQNTISTKKLLTGQLGFLLEHHAILGLEHVHGDVLDHQVDARRVVPQLVNGKNTLTALKN